MIKFWMLCWLLFSCSNDGASRKKTEKTVNVLELSQVAEGRYSYYTFNNPLRRALEEKEINWPGATFYEGTLFAHDGAKVRVYAARVPSASVDRILIQINGGTGSDARSSLNYYNHKAVVMISMRGLHTDDIREAECPLGAGLINCLKSVSYLKQVNPKDNGKDVVTVMRIILGELGSLRVDGRAQGHSFFGVRDKTFNMETGSYGATIAGYALAEGNLPSMGRIFLEGPSSPEEYVITDGFRNTQVFLANIMTALGMNDSEKQSFINVLKARHSSHRDGCDVNLVVAATEDCLSSAMIFTYLKNSYEDVVKGRDATQVNTGLATLKSALLAVSATDTTSTAGLSSVLSIYNSDTLEAYEIRGHTTWAKAKFDFLSGESLFNGRREPGFTSRVGQICSAYIKRADGDSTKLFDKEKAKAANDPYWYGFLIGYRDFLDICDQVASNLTAGITIPDGEALDLTVEAMVQYGAGVDEKHHQQDIDDMASYIDDATSVVRSAYLADHAQGGHGPPGSADCLSRLIVATFETATDLAGELDRVMAADCGL